MQGRGHVRYSKHDAAPAQLLEHGILHLTSFLSLTATLSMNLMIKTPDVEMVSIRILAMFLGRSGSCRDVARSFVRIATGHYCLFSLEFQIQMGMPSSLLK